MYYISINNYLTEPYNPKMIFFSLSVTSGIECKVITLLDLVVDFISVFIHSENYLQYFPVHCFTRVVRWNESFSSLHL